MEDETALRRTCCQTLGKALKGEFKRQNLGFSGANYELFPFSHVAHSVTEFIIKNDLNLLFMIKISDAKVSRCPGEILWFFYGISTNTVMVTSLVYWSAFWNPDFSNFYKSDAKFKHSIPALTVVLDICLNGLPIRLLHAIYPMIFGILYSTFSYFYFDAVNDEPIYPILDWSKPLKSILACSMIVTFSLIMQVGLPIQIIEQEADF
ncbi:unnamed protein product [Rodentolepis nana]|uniref:Aa_trans domain-containing protein n=1 Tax=Rodentolepis nana TaxID=102285 RepID=A0A0R3T8V8_RODNA|nr:unnamed protein product [Rodentolepis nana]